MTACVLLLLAAPAAAVAAEPVDPAPYADAFQACRASGEACLGSAATTCRESLPDGGSRATLVCSEMELGLWEAEMSAHLVTLRRRAIADDATRAALDGSDAIQLDAALAVSQSHWRAFADADCAWRALRAGGGRTGALARSDCLRWATADRTDALRSLAEQGP